MPKTKSSKHDSLPTNALFGWVWAGAAVYCIAMLTRIAYRIRMGAIDEFGAVIHEFDPYFNFRATEVSQVGPSVATARCGDMCGACLYISPEQCENPSSIFSNLFFVWRSEVSV